MITLVALSFPVLLTVIVNLISSPTIAFVTLTFLVTFNSTKVDSFT